MKKIIVSCSVQDRVDYKLLKPFQGNLKELSEQNFEKIKKSIIEEGFFMPIGVWEHEGELFILDGHQRKLVLEWLDQNGYEIPLIPIFRIHADSFKNARKKLLHMVSQYGKVTGEGLYEFSIEAEMGIDDLKEFSIPDMDMDQFIDSYFLDKEKIETEQLEKEILFTYKIEIECINEQNQQELTEELEARGFKVRVLI